MNAAQARKLVRNLAKDDHRILFSSVPQRERHARSFAGTGRRLQHRAGTYRKRTFQFRKNCVNG